MAIRKFSTASISAGTGKSSKLWDQETFQSGMFALATISLTSASSSIVFSDIPSGYTHLQLRGIAKNVTTGNADYDAIRVRVNGDSGTNYSWHYIQTQAASNVGSNGTDSANYYYSGGCVRSGTTGTNQANFYSTTIIDILDYSSTSKYKTFRGISGTEYAGTYSFLLFSGGSWRSTSAITSITLVTDTAVNFAANTSFALYGIKGA
jgi:hypothetical protein